MQTKAKCVHHWEIEIPNGPVSEGVCKNCGATREFLNSMFSTAHHITLEKEQGDDFTTIEQTEKKWNRWLNR